MTIELAPLPLPPSAIASKFVNFGREVKGVDPGNLTEDQFRSIEQLLYTVSVVFAHRPRRSLGVDSALVVRCSTVPRL